MNSHDPLERELMALQPAPAANDLRQRIAQSLSERPSPRRPVTWSVATLAAVAATIVIALVALRPNARHHVAVDQPSVPKQSNATSVLDPNLPTRLTYSRALSQSPEQLDRLLSEHAAWQRPTPDDLSIRAFARSRFPSQSHVGDM